MSGVDWTAAGSEWHLKPQSKHQRHAAARRPFALISILVLAGCRPAEPPPTYNVDLGTQDSVLLPTSSPWYDSAIAKGQSDWRPFRKPGAEPKTGHSGGDEVRSTGAIQAIEPALRGLVDDFNAALGENKIDELTDYLVDDQVAILGEVIKLIPVLAEKMKELAELLPGDNANLKRTVSAVSLSAVLKLEVASFTVSSPTEAIGKLAAPAGGVGDVRFVLVKDEEEYWYIDHPKIRALAPGLPAIQQSLPQLDAFIAGVKSGQIGGEALAQQAAALNQMLAGMIPAGAQPDAEATRSDPSRDAMPDDAGG